jgi:hypothetical protein
MRKLLLSISLLLSQLCFAQGPPTNSNPLGGNLTVQDAGTCTTMGSFLWQHLPSNAATTTVNLAGTFSGTLTIRLSNNGGGSWTTNNTTTSTGTTSISTNGFTDICADVTTFTSGSFAVTITTGLNTGPVGPAGPPGSGSISSVATLPAGGVCTVVGSSVSLTGQPGGIFQCGNDLLYHRAGTANVIDPTTYGISFDGHVCFGTHVSWTNGATPTITIDATCTPFDSTITGKKGFGTNCASALACYLNNGTAILPMGTLTYVNPTTATSSATATALCNTGACAFSWFTDDRVKWCCGAGTVDNAFQNYLAGCPSIYMPGGYSPIPFGLFNTNSTTCGVVTVVGNEAGMLDAGANLWGQGVANTKLIIPPDNNFASCTANANQGASNVCLFAGLQGGGNFTVTGLGHCNTGSNAKTLIGFSGSSTWWQNLTLTNFGCTDSAQLIGVNLPFSNKFDGIYSDGFGQGNIVSGVNVECKNCYFGENKGVPLAITGANTIFRSENLYIGATSSTISVWVGSGGAAGVKWYSKHDQNYGACGASGAQIYTDSGGTAFLDDWYGGNCAYDVELNAGGKVYATNSKFSGTTHCIGTGGVTLTTGAFFDKGGNSCTSGNQESTLIPTCPTVTGATATCAAVAGSMNEQGTLRVTVTAAGTATGTVTMNFAGTFSGMNSTTPSCVFTPALTGTGVWNARATTFMSTRSSTAPIITWDNNAANLGNLTWDIDYRCTAR